MSREQLIAMARRNLEHVQAETVDQAEGVYRVPATNYYEPTRWRREMDGIFKRLPLLLGFSSELRDPGSYRAMVVAETPVLLTRTRGGELRGLSQRVQPSGRPRRGRGRRQGQALHMSLPRLELRQRRGSRFRLQRGRFRRGRSLVQWAHPVGGGRARGVDLRAARSQNPRSGSIAGSAATTPCSQISASTIASWPAVRRLPGRTGRSPTMATSISITCRSCIARPSVPRCRAMRSTMHGGRTSV